MLTVTHTGDISSRASQTALLSDAMAMVRDAVAYRRGVAGTIVAITDVAEAYGLSREITRRLYHGETRSIRHDRYLLIKLARVIDGRRRVLELEMRAQAEREATARHEADLKKAMGTWGLFSGVVARISQVLSGQRASGGLGTVIAAPTDGARGTTG
jgi:hypothetical protein